jgi:hypothetical protein
MRINAMIGLMLLIIDILNYVEPREIRDQYNNNIVFPAFYSYQIIKKSGAAAAAGG